MSVAQADDPHTLLLGLETDRSHAVPLLPLYSLPNPLQLQLSPEGLAQPVALPGPDRGDLLLHHNTGDTPLSLHCLRINTEIRIYMKAKR